MTDTTATDTTTELDPQADPQAAVTKFKDEASAVRLKLKAFGIARKLENSHEKRAAELFGAEVGYLSSRKKLLNTRHEAIRKITNIRTQITDYWRTQTLPYPENGIRLIKQTQIGAFEARLNSLSAEMDIAVAEADAVYQDMKEAAREQLGDLYNESDYPSTLVGAWGVSWDYPSIEPPEYLKKLSPQLYAREKQRIAARFDEAVQLAEEAFSSKLSALVAHLQDRLTGTNAKDKPKVIRDSAVTNLREFFDTFAKLNIGSNSELDAAVAAARNLMDGVDPGELRKSSDKRAKLANDLDGLKDLIDPLLVDAPERMFNFDDES